MSIDEGIGAIHQVALEIQDAGGAQCLPARVMNWEREKKPFPAVKGGAE